VAQSNAAYIVRSKLLNNAVPASSSPAGAITTAEGGGKMTWLSPEETLNRIVYREYMLSGKIHFQMESFFHLANCYFHGSCGVVTPRIQSRAGEISMMMTADELQEKAIYYYQLASYGKNPIATAYLAMIYHFDLIGSKQQHLNSPNLSESAHNDVDRRDLTRARRYYEELLSDEKNPESDTNSLKQRFLRESPQFYYVVSMYYKILLYSERYRWFGPISYLLEKVMGTALVKL
jgi:hypothetical protein